MDSSSLKASGASSGSGDALHGLKFGQKIYFEDGGGGSGSSSKPPPASAKDAAAPPPPGRKGKGVAQGGQQQPPRCQVEGCNADLTGAKAYYCRHKVCGMHSKAPKVIVAGLEQRFCQQCSSYPNFSCAAARDVWPTARTGDRMANNEWRGVLDAPSHAAALHGTHPCFQGPPVGAFCSPMELPPGECLAGVSDSSCALSLLSTDPWSSNSAGNRCPVIPASSTFDGQPRTHSVIPSNYFNSSWGTRGHGTRISSHEIQHEMGLAGGTTNVSDAHFTGQGEFSLQENGHCLDHGSDRAYDHSGPGMHWSL
ncbi:hypothetical protein B296_00025571 [Ensete ventricosum]|uniref:SBP-type domain-containing protein n=1 Tax=Ensete ventricosum TaxID=4639 RepID=A0A426ZMB7_ENSVE|nr:hypothetical protein B296_00025571 [Ensete ventricosum]